VQVDPIKPTLKASGAKRLKLEYDELLSSFGFKFNLRRYFGVASRMLEGGGTMPTGQGMAVQLISKS
jgi:hypothetical protein